MCGRNYEIRGGGGFMVSGPPGMGDVMRVKWMDEVEEVQGKVGRWKEEVEEAKERLMMVRNIENR